jgi:hypothetical protein
MVTMTENKSFVERRIWHRFRVNDIARVDFATPHMFNVIKPSVARSPLIIDTSRAGLSFIYEDNQIRPTDFDRLSIVMDANKIVVEDLPYQVVSDDPIFPHHNATFARRCGVSFGQLTSTQRCQLDRFIRNHTRCLRAMDRRTGTDPGTPDNPLYSGPERRKIFERSEHPFPT